MILNSKAVKRLIAAKKARRLVHVFELRARVRVSNQVWLSLNGVNSLKAADFVQVMSESAVAPMVTGLATQSLVKCIKGAAVPTISGFSLDGVSRMKAADFVQIMNEQTRSK